MHLDRIVALSQELSFGRSMRDHASDRLAEAGDRKDSAHLLVNDLLRQLANARQLEQEAYDSVRVWGRELAARRHDCYEHELKLEQAIRDEARAELPHGNREQRRLELLRGMGA